MREKGKSTSPSVIQAYNRPKDNILEKLDVISRLDKGEVVDIRRNLIRTMRDNADRVTQSKSDVWLTVHRNSVWIRKTN